MLCDCRRIIALTHTHTRAMCIIFCFCVSLLADTTFYFKNENMIIAFFPSYDLRGTPKEMYLPTASIIFFLFCLFFFRTNRNVVAVDGLKWICYWHRFHSCWRITVIGNWLRERKSERKTRTTKKKPNRLRLVTWLKWLLPYVFRICFGFGQHCCAVDRPVGPQWCWWWWWSLLGTK